jgi:uncharacterized membrane protein (DUF485 family)
LAQRWTRAAIAGVLQRLLTESPTPDWEGLEHSPEFRELVAVRRRFVVPALAVFVVWFGGFLVLTAYARDFMSKTPIGSLSWAYLLALSLIAMTWLLAWLYLRWSDRHLAPLAERMAAESPERER